jgi:hypothetical protein
VLHQSGIFIVRIGQHATETGFTSPGYEIFNTETGIVENSSTMLFDAIQWCDRLDLFLKEVKEPKAKEKLSWPDIVEASPSKPN